jgi:hypothetical protein
MYFLCRSQWLLIQRRGSAAARLLVMWVRTPPMLGGLSVVNTVCCTYMQRSVLRADRSPKGVVPFVCVCVTECNQVQQLTLNANSVWVEEVRLRKEGSLNVELDQIL